MLLIPDNLIEYIPTYNLFFLLFAVAFGLWLNNKTKSDLLCIILAFIYMFLHWIIFEPPWDEWLFFFFGLTIGYITDYWGVKSKKWKYHPWDPDFGYSYYVGTAWGMVTMFTYSASKAIPDTVEGSIFAAVVFLIPMILAEYKYGETRKDQYFLFARAIFTFLAFYSNFNLLFVAIFVGTYIEWAGVYWLKNWIYIDTISFVFLSFGYSLLILSANLIVDLLANNNVELIFWILYLLAAVFYAIDTFWAQKQVVKKYNLNNSDKAVVAANIYKNSKK